MARAGKAVQVYLPEETVARLKTLAEGNRRTMTAEIELAIERHLAAPQSPPALEKVAPPEVEPPARRPRGRPRKDKAGDQGEGPEAS